MSERFNKRFDVFLAGLHSAVVHQDRRKELFRGLVQKPIRTLRLMWLCAEIVCFFIEYKFPFPAQWSAQ
jgi:hypothetical protein